MANDITYPHSFAAEFVKGLHQIARQEEDTSSRRRDASGANDVRGADIHRYAAMSPSERDLIIVMASSLGLQSTDSNYLLEGLERENVDAIPQYLGHDGGYHNRAQQFLGVYRALQNGHADDIVVNRYSPKDLMDKLLALYGSFFDMPRAGRISTADHINAISFIETGQPLPDEFSNQRVIDDLATFLLAEVDCGKPSVGTPAKLDVPAITPANPAWLTWMLGRAAQFTYGHEPSIDSELGELSFPYFINAITGADPELVRHASQAAIRGNAVHHIQGCMEYDKRLADVFACIVAGTYTAGRAGLPPELQQMGIHAAVYREATADGHLVLEEGALLAEYLRGIDGVRHPDALDILLQMREVSDPYSAGQHAPSASAMFSESPFADEQRSSAIGSISRPKERLALPLDIVLNYLEIQQGDRP